MGLDSVKINWINDLVKTTNCVCLQLQEHFKATRSLKNYFKKYFTDFDNHPTPAVRENLSHSGRQTGGLV